MRVLLTLIIFVMSACGGAPDTSPTPTLPTVPIIGLDIYLAQNSSKDCRWIDAYVDAPALGMTLLWLPEGRSDTCLMRFLEDTRPTVIQLLIGNGVCERKGNCTEAEQQQAKDLLITNTIDALDFIRAYSRGPTEIQIIVSLEDNMQYAEARDVCEDIKPVVGDAEVWRNPVMASGHDFSDDCFDGVRLHNKEQFPTGYKGKCSWSNDGLDLDLQGATVWSLSDRIHREALLSESRARRGRGCDIYLWNADLSNCLKGDSSGARSPSSRDCSGSNHDIHITQSLLTDLRQI